jgi:hypothetical protein
VKVELTALGFLLTLVTIRGVPMFAEVFGWQWASPWLAAGPVLGIAAMAKLRSGKTVGVATERNGFAPARVV